MRAMVLEFLASREAYQEFRGPWDLSQVKSGSALQTLVAAKLEKLSKLDDEELLRRYREAAIEDNSHDF